jgi:hypothetical protein
MICFREFSDMELLILISVYAAIFGFLGTVVAKNKSVNPAIGFWWGCLLGPIGLVIIALLSAEPKPPSMVKTVERFSALGVAEADTSNDAYRLWLVRKYKIEKNDTLAKFIVGTSLLNDLEAAISLADSLERTDILRLSEQHLSEKRNDEEANLKLMSQRESDRLEYSEFFRAMRKFAPTTILVVVIYILFVIVVKMIN